MDEERQNKILLIAHGYTQAAIYDPTWPGRTGQQSFWNKAEIEAGHGSSNKLDHIEGDFAIMIDGARWPLSVLVYHPAVTEAQGFEMLQPNLSVEGCVRSMLSPEGHGYGHLTQDYDWQKARKA
jgi:hypothetical protein